MNLGEEIEKVKGEYGRKNGGADKEPGCESVGQKIKLLKAFIWCKRGKRVEGRRKLETFKASPTLTSFLNCVFKTESISVQTLT